MAENQKLIEIRIPKATLFLTEQEYIRAIKLGKSILRKRQLDKRLGVKNENF